MTDPIIPSDGQPEPEAERPITSTIQTSLVVPQVTSESALQLRVMARRGELVAKLIDLKTDVRGGVAETRGKLKAKLSELAHIVKWGVGDGWASVGDPVTLKLEEWLTESARQLAFKHERS
ncbi:MAG TPA: hypothetical protein VK601_08630 [Kofleriaceae bacterium]|nr:hypothetical protein [Kofleriaceae bacterium]